MLSKIIDFSLKSKYFILLLTTFIVGFGIFSLTKISVGAVPDITNNQVQVITTSRNLSTAEVEQFITYPVELEMSNLPGVKEIRSVSKFGLSVVTIVFEDDLGTYIPRQLISEKIDAAKEKIPAAFGTPEMGPITTGLGEIYQYTLEVDEAYKDNYSVMDLRSIQDWVVKRQLSGIPNVVEINTWGGFLKEYEVAINTEKLQALNLSIDKVFSALEKNNSITGGSYIERNDQAYFIRGEGLVKSLEDIKKISVENRDGNPIFINDVATVKYGHARRFGAITGNGEGEKILGQVMMLKGADANSTIQAVKERLNTIEQSLPEGVHINGFLDRSELIGKTTFTIAENLILGLLVVAFIVILLIGDLRSGLIISSVIPLSFLIAISLMYIFDIDANLMSMGALDFGIIIDGAVIIVEFVAFKMMLKHKDFKALKSQEYKNLKDKITLSGASKMMNSAIFGQLIILIVFIPIMTLSGTEGKMFRPMAITFSFALLGAMFLCFTWIPVACSLFLKPKIQKTTTISYRFMHFAKKTYLPILKWSLAKPKIIIGAAIFLIILGGFTFSRMGSEFVPTLDEGDFVIQPVLKTGKSLNSTIERTTMIEKILLERFPEVIQVVSRIGAAEVPTDPMSMQDSDVIIRLKPKSEWVSADTKDELADKMKEALSVIPGMEIQFTQPIEMRFNELVSGVQTDIAIKIFGEDLNILAAKANEVQHLISNIEGAADISVEKTVGLPEMTVNYKRDKIARYGLNIEDINNIVAAGFAGKQVGVVFEGERRFDIVVRLDDKNRQDISDVENLMIDTPESGKIPLSEVAEIKLQKGPAKISRDETKRRIVIGVNVRNRDLKSVVTDIQNTLTTSLTLPTGYSVTYGGEFENLESASKRLKIVVPIILVLIYLLLLFALKKHRDALLIFTAIPFASVGGILFLWLRDMPFSISAGVGFIALFGIAVLNGIILAEYFKSLKQNKPKLTKADIITATQERLRAVLLTASSTALGFLPMAISTGAGAEVQKPLATVVIGGLATSTLLTLIVLPVLYMIVENRIKKPNLPKTAISIVVLSLLSFSGFSQEKEIEKLEAQMLKNNNNLKAQQLNTQALKTEEGNAYQFDKTSFSYSHDNLETDPMYGESIYTYSLAQDFKFPTVYGSQKRLLKTKTAYAETQTELNIILQKKALRLAYQNYLTNTTELKIYRQLDSIYSDFTYMAKRKFEEGESNYLEKITAEAKQQQLEVKLNELKENRNNALLALQQIIQPDGELLLKNDSLAPLSLNLDLIASNPSLTLEELNVKLSEQEVSLAKNELLPDISLSYSLKTNSYISNNYDAYQIGVKIPLLFFGNRAKIKALKYRASAAALIKEQKQLDFDTKKQQLLNNYQTQKNSLDNFKSHQLIIADEIIKNATSSYKNGEIDFFRYVQSIENAQEIKLAYLKLLSAYNYSTIQLNYFTLNY
ncbi:cobalt-zinc-cadmium resistance protein CzcA [Mesonia hippocampi]|uniref:Cobalt-zinc-cadmium resistance protein CzcA n=1 Tax=Mesonia hippocampi TaxID=1628250 RepID=A0A840ES65_9FLAO|nr:CusA/CzcA family heavy metal efflux RND transporter [Mesonia hippocampi]MBB4119373.1 cobalt-zinc-cadmium resistance protein CzcA [Mesonia hippocampi]